jgi:hypothetical protein
MLSRVQTPYGTARHSAARQRAVARRAARYRAVTHMQIYANLSFNVCQVAGENGG